MKPLMAAKHDNCHHEQHNNRLAASKEKHALNVAFFSFVAFCILETVFGTIAKSESMLADAHAMSIDAMTYLFNIAAEHYKRQPLSQKVLALRLSPEEQARRLELRRLYLELVPPAISVCILFTLTAMTLVEAFNTLLGSSKNAAGGEANGGGEGDKEEEEDDDVSVPLMLWFSAANLLLDFVNVACFSRANATYGLNVVVDLHTITKHEDEESQLLSSATAGDKMLDQPSERTSSSTSSSTIRYAEYGAASSSSYDDDVFDDDDLASISSTDSSTRPPPTTSEKLINLNMCSAWTHVCADTLRSLAVVIAALIATIFPAIPGETADAAAAVAVSMIIFVSLIPLIQGLVITAFAIRNLRPYRNSTSNRDSTAAATACSYHECSSC
jgi:Co/Zn/Cd efflux system component